MITAKTRSLAKRFVLAIPQHLALDLRALGLFRIALGCLLLADVGFRAQDLEAHYGETGVLPRSALTTPSILAYGLAPHLWLDIPFGNSFLVGLAALAAVGVLLGIQTRPLLLLSWLLCHSIQVRNPDVNHAGDKVLILMILWALFLPLDRSYSVVKKRRPNPSNRSNRVASFAAIGLFLQLASIYFLGALRKSGQMWQDGTAVWYTLQIDQYARPWTHALLDYPLLLNILTWATLGIEHLAPLLLLLGTGKVRCFSLLLLALIQLGFLATLELGLFPWISLGVLTFALPSWCFSPNVPAAVPAARSVLPIRYGFGEGLAATLLATLILWNLGSLFRYPNDLKQPLPRWIVASLEVLRFDAYWSMFAPNPMTLDGWYSITGELRSGRQVNLLQPNQPPANRKPIAVIASFPSDRWKEYLMTLTDLGDPPERWAAVGQYLAKEWEAQFSSADPIVQMTVTYHLERTTPKGEASPVPETVWVSPPREDVPN